MPSEQAQWERNRYKYWLSVERKKNKAHLKAKKANNPNYKRRTIWGQTCPFMSMLSDRPKIETKAEMDERMIRILDKQVHRISVYKK